MRNHFQAALVSALDSKIPKTPPLARHGRSIVPNRSEPERTVACASNSRNPKTPPLARRAKPLGTMALPRKPYGRSIVPNRSEPERTVTCESNSRKIEDAAACAPRRAIGDNGSTKEDPW